MLTFLQFLREWPINDIRYFKALPDTNPPAGILEIAKKFHVEHLVHFKTLHNRCFTHSREMEDGIVGMVEGDSYENWTHELGHIVYDHCDKAKIKPVLDDIKNKYELKDGKDMRGLRWLEIDGYDYSFNHSGKQFIYDEIFAISFSIVEGNKETFDGPTINAEFSEVLSDLQKSPLFNPDPYSENSEGPVG